jgi:hypothetical protein
MLSCASLAAKYATARAAFAVSVRAGEAAVYAYFFESFAVFFSEISAQIIV